MFNFIMENFVLFAYHDDIENFENGEWTSQWHFRSRSLIGEGFIFYSREGERERKPGGLCVSVYCGGNAMHKVWVY